MRTLSRLPPFPLLTTSQRSTSSSTLPQFQFPNAQSQTKVANIHCSKFDNFLDLKPVSKPASLELDLPWVDPSSGCSSFDVIVAGTGPSGLCLAEKLSGHGVRVCCVDPSPLSPWPNNYGMWVDEAESLGLEDCLDRTWPKTCVFINDHNAKSLDSPYGRVNRKALKTKLLQGCVSNGVKFHQSKVWKAEHEEFESLVFCSDGNELKASLVVDSSGYSSTLIEYDKPRNHGYQVAYGILAEVDSHPFDLDKVVLLDWRDGHLADDPSLVASNSRLPTFLYAMPIDSNLIFLEETCLVGRPGLSLVDLKNRMVLRLRHLGIGVKNVMEDEKGLIPMGGPLPRIPQRVMAFGGSAGLVHPSTGYMLARTLALAPVMADAIADCLGSTTVIRGKPLCGRVWNNLWPVERRCIREYYSFGMETLLRLDLDGIRRFFDAFFELDSHHLKAFLASRLSLREVALLGFSMIRHASNASRLDMVTKCPAPFARMIGNIALEFARSHHIF